MQTWYNIFPRNVSLTIFTWIVFCMLPFFFVFQSSSWMEIVIGIFLIFLFFISYRLTFLTKGWLVYLWVGIAIAISIILTVFFAYVYFALFLAFMIGTIQNKVGFFVLYGILVASTMVTANIGFFTQNDLFFSQFPFVIVSMIGVILLPLNSYNRIKRVRLEDQLENANKRISQLIVMEERQRIARDLHDTLGQKLSLIGLKSDLAAKLLTKNTDAAKSELLDINQTARTALKEVRELVSDMRGVKLEDEVVHVIQLLRAAEISHEITGDPVLVNTPLLVENVLSMCMKEAVTNVVKHSGATECRVHVEQDAREVRIIVRDNGTGFSQESVKKGNGLNGMRERLEFVNGHLDVESSDGTALTICVPSVIRQMKKEDFA